MTTASVRLHQLLIVAALTGAVAMATGCVSTKGRTVYTRAHTNQSFRVEAGTVIAVRSVVIEGDADSRIGQYGGGGVGAVAGSSVGSGRGAALGAVGGGVAGMVVGREIEKAVTRKEGLEITIALDNGDQIIVVQEESKGGFQDGDRVRVMMGQGTTMVMH